MAAARGVGLARLIASIDTARGPRSLASACRLAALESAKAG
jgi:predicted DNA-binding ribbon-helix-helix protein